jgi:predicted GH43/DUF377 family glycosyl hydrolase
MKWERLGQIYDPRSHKLPNGCFGFAQSPQAVVFDDFVRVFFSTRERDTLTTFRSHVTFVDFEKDLTTIRRMSTQTVIPLGELGCFDEHGIFPMNVLREGDRIHAYTTGWNRKRSVSADASIGYAYSDDEGLSFRKHGNGPVLTASLTEPFLVCDAFVQKFGQQYHMWYIFGVRWFVDEIDKSPQRVYKIAHAVSEDGINWARSAQPIIEDRIDSNECQALPTVIMRNGLYLMFFCYRNASGFRTDRTKGYRIGCASSTDLSTWKRDDALVPLNVPEQSWDSDMQCYPFAFQCENQHYLLYNGNEFGRNGFGIATLKD